MAIFWAAQRDWHNYCPYIEFCYNTTPNVTTGLSPFYIAYGQEARIPAEAISGRLSLRESPPEASGGKAELFADQLALIRRIAHDNYVKSQNKSKPLIDADRTDVEYGEGEKVWVYQNQIKTTAGGSSNPAIPAPG